jgi:hypothetical protein
MLRGVLRQHLGDQEYLVAAPFDRLADEVLGAAVGIHFRRIDQRHAELDAEAQRRDLIRPPPGVFGHVPSALAKHRNLLAGREHS